MSQVRRGQLVLVLVIGFVASAASPSSGQVPPRFYWKSLTGGHAVPVIVMSLSGNANPIDPAHTVHPLLKDASFEAIVAQVGYAHTFAILDRAVFAALLVPMGRLSGEVTILGTPFREDASGFGDPLLEIALNLIGPKAIRNIPDLVRYEPGFSLDVLIDVSFPIGEYHNNQPLNLGQNRWFGRIGAPIVWQLGPWVPGRRTTLEVFPSVWFYGDNDDFVGRKLSTDPMFQLEAHLTRDLAESLWASFDVTWMAGGQASIDGVRGDKLNNIGLGFTLGYQINDYLQLTGAYAATVNDNGPTDLRLDRFQVSLVFGWHALIEGMKRLED